MNFVLIHKFAELSGYTVKAIEQKIYNGIWAQGREYRKAPDGRVHISIKGVQAWVEKGQV